ncbi:MAG: hypothetical protein PUF61_06245 [Spirochaetales bacterium]|nr:hypothetical protein [Spirochaetales bacterium]
MKYYEVHAKCGHVGRNNYYEGILYIWAENGKKAAAIARKMPRVKHDQKDAILSVTEISKFNYEQGLQAQKNSAYWTSMNVQEQRMNCPELTDVIIREKKNKKFFEKKHTLRHNYNAIDPLYTEFSSFRGNIRADMLG